MSEEILDILIVGAGPAGLAAACAASDAGLNYLVIERRGPVQSLVEHPQQIQYFSPSDEMAIGGVPFPMRGGHKPTREDALAYYRNVVASKKLELATWEEVVDVRRDGEIFHVQSVKRVAENGERFHRKARFLLVCAGTFPNPRKLDVPGGDAPNVFSRLDDPTPFFGRDVLVVGGGNSAATGAMTLAESGANVTLAMRRAPEDYNSHLRPFIVRDLNIQADEKRLNLLTNVAVTRIDPGCVHLLPTNYESGAATDDPFAVPADFVFALLGHTADFGLFSHLGIPLASDGLPEYDEETAETSVKNLFVAGSLSRANIILESRRRAVEIVEEIVRRAAAPTPASPPLPRVAGEGLVKNPKTSGQDAADHN